MEMCRFCSYNYIFHMNMFISRRVHMYTGSSIFFKIVGMLFLQLNDAPVSFKRLVQYYLV
jgi:hypothetical protein